MAGPFHHAKSHRANSVDGMPVLWHVKVFADGTAVSTGDGARSVVVTDDLGGTFLRSAHATVTTVSSSGAVTVQVHNATDAVDMLSTATTIDESETSSYTAATPHVVDKTGTPPKNQVSRGDVIRVDVDGAGTGAKGLEVLLEFGPNVML